MTELSFLIELLLNHDLKKETKDSIAARIKEVEQGLVYPKTGSPEWFTAPAKLPGMVNPVIGPSSLAQAPSTLALMAKHGDIPYVPTQPIAAPLPPPVLTTEQVAQRQAMLSKPKNKPLSTR